MARLEDRAYFEQIFNEEHADHRVYHVLRYNAIQENLSVNTVTITAKVLCKRKDADVSYQSQRVIVPLWMAEESGCDICPACASVLDEEWNELGEDDG